MKCPNCGEEVEELYGSVDDNVHPNISSWDDGPGPMCLLCHTENYLPEMNDNENYTGEFIYTGGACSNGRGRKIRN